MQGAECQPIGPQIQASAGHQSIQKITSRLTIAQTTTAFTIRCISKKCTLTLPTPLVEVTSEQVVSIAAEDYLIRGKAGGVRPSVFMSWPARTSSSEKNGRMAPARGGAGAFLGGDVVLGGDQHNQNLTR
jgi:hypothetical protein